MKKPKYIAAPIWKGHTRPEETLKARANDMCPSCDTEVNAVHTSRASTGEMVVNVICGLYRWPLRTRHCGSLNSGSRGRVIG